MGLVTTTRDVIDFGLERVVRFNETDIRAYTSIKLMKFSYLDYVSFVAEQVNMIANERGYTGKKSYISNANGKFCVFRDEKGRVEGSIQFSDLHILNYKKKLEIEYYGASEKDISQLARSFDLRIKELELRDVGSRLYISPSQDGRREIARGVDLFFTKEYNLKLTFGR